MVIYILFCIGGSNGKNNKPEERIRRAENYITEEGKIEMTGCIITLNKIERAMG